VAEDTQDQSQRTEEPSQRRLEQAREKGRFAKSQEINHWFMILALTALLAAAAKPVGEGVIGALLPFVESPESFRIEGTDLPGLGADLGRALLIALLPVFALAIAAALAAGFLQTGLRTSTEPLVPKLEKLSPLKGFKRLFSSRAVVDLVKGLLKITIVAAVVLYLLWPDLELLPGLVTRDLGGFLELTRGLALKITGGVVAVMTLIAGLDYLYQRHQHMKQLRMSRQDLKDELKQTEGDPMVKARLRQIRAERARRRMMAAVPEADVVITNPTHFAVALKYEAAEMGAPRLVAKGVDALALKIRETAEAHGVPVVENPPLARALHQGVGLDEEIRPEHYKAVASVIAYVMRLKTGRASGLRDSNAL
jgi:flagellar biosynthetic protein FlhB